MDLITTEIGIQQRFTKIDKSSVPPFYLDGRDPEQKVLRLSGIGASFTSATKTFSPLTSCKLEGPFVPFSLATTESYTKDGEQEEGMEWPPARRRFVFVGKIAEFARECPSKGSGVYVEGRLKTKNGKTRKVTGCR